MIKYVTGNVVNSDVPGLKILPHIVNTLSAWGSGVVIPIGRKWPLAKESYHDWYDSTVHACDLTDRDVDFMLGEVQFVQVEKDWIVANMLGQKTPGGDTINNVYVPPIRLDCVRECMMRVAELAKKLNATIVAPWFGTLRAGSTKEVIKGLIEELWADCEVVMYEFEEKK